MPFGAPDPILKTLSGVPFKFGIDIVMEGFGIPAAKRLMSAVRRLNDTGPLLRVIARRVVQSQKQNILEQRDPAGQPWQPLKRQRGPGRSPGSKALFDSGRLYEAITYREVDEHTVRVGTFDVPYARYHQLGTRPYTIVPKSAKRLRFWGGNGWVFSKRVNHPGLPARPFVGVRDGDVPTIQQMAAAFAQASFTDARAA